MSDTPAVQKSLATFKEHFTKITTWRHENPRNSPRDPPTAATISLKSYRRYSSSSTTSLVSKRTKTFTKSWKFPQKYQIFVTHWNNTGPLEQWNWPAHSQELALRTCDIQPWYRVFCRQKTKHCQKYWNPTQVKASACIDALSDHLARSAGAWSLAPHACAPLLSGTVTCWRNPHRNKTCLAVVIADKLEFGCQKRHVRTASSS